MENLEEKKNYKLAKKIEHFFAEYNCPPFGYAPGLEGQENEEQWIQTIKEDIENGEAWIRLELGRLAGDHAKGYGVCETAKDFIKQIESLGITQKPDFASKRDEYDYRIDAHLHTHYNHRPSLNIIQGMELAYEKDAASRYSESSTEDLLKWLKAEDGGDKVYALLCGMDKQYYINMPDSLSRKGLVWSSKSDETKLIFENWDSVAAYLKEDPFHIPMNEVLATEVDSEKKRLFVDLDGTVAEFKHVDTLEVLYEEGYFRNLKPIPNMIKAVKFFLEKYPEIEVFSLSSVLTDSKYALEEKNAWIDEHLPEIDRNHRLYPPCGSSKKEYVLDKLRYIGKNDYLVDDYTQNLLDWEPPAKGIKLLNGINHTNQTWKGNMLSVAKKPSALAQDICEVMSGREIRDNNPIVQKSRNRQQGEREL